MHEAAALGVLQVHLSGGEPAARRDLVEITAGARAAGLYTNLITSAVGVTNKLLRRARRRRPRSCADLDPGQRAVVSRPHRRLRGRLRKRKRALAAEVVRRKLPLTVNAVMHRANIERIGEMVDLALALGASRVEIAHVQYYGWALKNRAMLMPTREQVERAGGAGRGPAHASPRQHRHRRGGAGLLRALSQALRRRLGPALAQRDAGRQGAALPRRGDRFPASNSGTCAIIRSPISGRTRRRSTRSAAPTG